MVLPWVTTKADDPDASGRIGIEVHCSPFHFQMAADGPVIRDHAPRDRRAYLDELISRGKPSFGHLAMALLMCEKPLPHRLGGVPVTRKSFRQRLGRVGRQRPGSFAVVAEPYAFKRFGSTLAEYYERSVEPSYLYLRNRFMQFAHARCLAEELEMLGVTGRKALPTTVQWPEGFAEVFEFGYAGGPAARPREFDQINRIGGDQPHFNYPLRNVPEDAYKVVHSRGGPAGSADVARLTVQQAIREAFPGAIYRTWQRDGGFTSSEARRSTGRYV